MRVLTKRSRFYAFSLIELMVVISVASLLIAIVAPAWSSYNTRLMVLTNANEVAAELRNAREKAFRSGYFVYFYYQYNSSKRKTYYSYCRTARLSYINLSNGVLTGNAGWGGNAVTNSLLSKVHVLDRRCDFYSSATATSALSNAYISFDIDGSVFDTSGYVKSGDNYVIYVGSGGYCVPITISPIGRITVG
ncbi:MAG: Tfp pilus assembly protein FimT/FimU [Candidatus Bruticola sp.]